MAPADKPELLSSGAGLGAAVAAESGTELGAIDVVEARGYWEQVWRRFRRDKAAIVSGLFIIFLLLAAYPGAAIASRLLGTDCRPAQSARRFATSSPSLRPTR